MVKKKTPKKKGNDFEDKVKKTISSGGLWFAPGDIDFGKYCIECKYTDKKGFRIPLSMLEKLWNSSLDMGKEPMLTIGMKRNDNEIFMLNCTVSLKRQ